MLDLPVSITHWLTQYGSLALFIFLALGILALPIPDETLMILAGILISQSKLDILPSLLAAYAGSMCGITISYFIGRTAGAFLIHRYGKWIGISQAELQKVHHWFERFGKWLLFFGYFIAGVRHLTGYAAGTTEVSYRHFALFAYSGAIIWATSFITIGYFLGDRWSYYLENVNKKYGIIALVIAIALLCGAWIAISLYKKRSRH